MVDIVSDPFPSADALDELWRSAWGTPPPARLQAMLERSLGHVGAVDDLRYMGFVNVAWDSGIHAFLLDTCVHADWQRQGIATAMVQRAVEIARERGAQWLHVDFEPHLDGFYRRCGFRPTHAGLVRLG